MAAITFLNLPAEIHAIIAEQCQNNDLINLCLTSKLMNERCWHVLYRHVNLVLYKDHIFIKDDGCPCASSVQLTNLYERNSTKTFCFGLCRAKEIRTKQHQFVNTLLSHPEYGKHIRSFKTIQYEPRSSDHSEEEFWHVMQSLSRVQIVELDFPNFHKTRLSPAKQLPNNLFQSAVSVKLVENQPHNPVKSILDSINPATLKHLCLDVVDDSEVERSQGGDGQTFCPESDLLTRLTGRCTALRTLNLRKRHCFIGYGFTDLDSATYEACWIAWASFIRSVKGTLEDFTFELQRGSYRSVKYPREFEIADESFQRLILPAIVSGSSPCLTTVKIRGVKHLNGQDGTNTLATELRAALGENAKIVVVEPIEE